ncbi:hypothetical protein L1887_61639 [Cichorium endivia]|nr:hypothetical protein L1887_61639 [Cichorium endivia]
MSTIPKSLNEDPLEGKSGASSRCNSSSNSVCTGLLVPSVGDALLALTGRVVPRRCYFEEIRVLKASLRSNPVNHRVFERKLRPKPSGRGHACLGVTHRVAPNHASLIGTHGIGAEIGLRAYGAVGLNWSPLRWTHD